MLSVDSLRMDRAFSQAKNYRACCELIRTRPSAAAARPVGLTIQNSARRRRAKYAELHNESPKPYIWTAKASDVLAEVKRARQALDNRHSA